MKEQDKTPEKQLNEVQIGNLLEKEFRIMIVKMIQDLGKRTEAKIEKMQEMFNRDIRRIKEQTPIRFKEQTEMNNTITVMKNTLEGINSRLNDTREQISELEDRIVDITEAEQKKEKQI